MKPLALAALAVSLSGCPKTPPVAEVPVDETWTIESGRVGRIVLGSALPDVLPADAEDRYFARYINDGQPHEGFRLDVPGLDVAMVGGPFAVYLDSHGYGEPPLDRLKTKAVRAARSGQLVSTVHVRDAAVRTAAGTGVGSTLAELRAAHGEMKVRPVPPSLGDDACVADSPALPGVWFVFLTCDGAEAGHTVSRVDLRP